MKSLFFISFPFPPSYLSHSWGSALTYHWCTFLLWAYGAPTRMHFSPTPSKRTSCLPRGTGLACTRYRQDRHREKKQTIQKTRQIWSVFWVFLQVGFKSASDYETFVWVRENDLPEINEVIQVKCKYEICVMFGQILYVQKCMLH